MKTIDIKKALNDYEQLLGMLDSSEAKDGLKLLGKARLELSKLEEKS
jgi:hypothetical protein